MKKIVVGITGGSGTILAVRLLENLKNCEVHLVMSESSKKVMELETDYSLDYIRGLSNYFYDDSNIAATVSSGSFIFDSLIIIPCSTSSMAKLAAGIADTLITRAGLVAMKERRRIIIVPREMPLSTIMIENMLKLSQNNVIIAPAIPGYYNKPESVDDMVNFIVSRVLDLAGVENHLSKRWKNV